MVASLVPSLDGEHGSQGENIVREMDPDAVVREAEIGRSLAGDDAVRGAPLCLVVVSEIECFFFSYDKVFLHTLFAFVRAGNIEDAVKLCRDAHQPWRVASIRGSLLFSWPAICEFPFRREAQHCYIVF